jgi:hypothetical protein
MINNDKLSFEVFFSFKTEVSNSNPCSLNEKLSRKKCRLFSWGGQNFSGVYGWSREAKTYLMPKKPKKSKNGGGGGNDAHACYLLESTASYIG